MNRTNVSILALSLATLCAGQAMAADTAASKTREQVNAEFAEAVRTGSIVSTIDGYGGMTLKEVFPSSYPAQAKVAGKTREQVNAEREQAVRTGDIVSTADGDAGKKLNELYPNNYPAHATVAGKTREQVSAEALQAVRTGALRSNPAY